MVDMHLNHDSDITCFLCEKSKMRWVAPG